MKHILVPVAGFARSGKDTLADAIYECLAFNEPTYSAMVVKFADELKQSLQDNFDQLGIKVNVFTEDTEEKARLRPLLVAYGEYCRSKNENIWVDKVIKVIDDFIRETVENSESTGSVILIPDMRYLNEYHRLERLAAKRGWQFVPIYIERVGNGPANNSEALSIGRMAAEGCFAMPNSLQLCFDEGETEAIRKWASKFTQSMSVY